MLRVIDKNDIMLDVRKKFYSQCKELAESKEYSCDSEIVRNIMRNLLALLVTPNRITSSKSSKAMEKLFKSEDFVNEVLSMAKMYLVKGQDFSILPLISNNLSPNAVYMEGLRKNELIITELGEQETWGIEIALLLSRNKESAKKIF